MRPPAKSGQAQRNYKQYLDVLTIHTHRRKTQPTGKGLLEYERMVKSR